jgi:sec-independent protein translocase protein TatB
VLDFGLGELLLLAAVALIVLGPEKLPHAARMAGAWYGRIRRTLANVQAEIANEVHLSEMRQRMNDELAKIQDTKNHWTDEMHEIGQTFENRIHPHLHSEVTETNEPTSIILSQETDWSHGIEAPLKTYRNGYYFFFVPHVMYVALIPSAPYLPKAHIVQNKRHDADPLANLTSYAHPSDLTSP